MRLAIGLGAYLVATIAAHFAVRGLLRLCPLSETTKKSGLKRAGTIIGLLERVFVLTLVLANQYAAIALVFAAKSIIRFEEAKDRQFAEYYLVGTMSSILLALLTGVLALWLVRVLS